MMAVYGFTPEQIYRLPAYAYLNYYYRAKVLGKYNHRDIVRLENSEKSTQPPEFTKALEAVRKRTGKREVDAFEVMKEMQGHGV